MQNTVSMFVFAEYFEINQCSPHVQSLCLFHHHLLKDRLRVTSVDSAYCPQLGRWYLVDAQYEFVHTTTPHKRHTLPEVVKLVRSSIWHRKTWTIQPCPSWIQIRDQCVMRGCLVHYTTLVVSFLRSWDFDVENDRKTDQRICIKFGINLKRLVGDLLKRCGRLLATSIWVKHRYKRGTRGLKTAARLINT